MLIDVANLEIPVIDDLRIPQPEIREELEMTLLALAYTPQEIQQAIAAISQDLQLQKNPNIEDWLRSAISWLTGD